MKNKKIICEIKMGMLKHNVYILNNENQIIENLNLTLTEIPNFIAQQTNIEYVYLTGLNKNFLQKIEFETKEIEKHKFSIQNNKKFYYNEETV